ncbi:MAG: cysteine desulfurase family protein [Gemmataceae bacterium]
MTVIDLDANATTPMCPEAWDAMRPIMLEASGNASSAHSRGRQARRFLDEARETVAHCLDAHPDDVVFTSGATEANNLALFGLAGDPPGHLITTAIEHPCVIEPVRAWESRGGSVSRVKVSEQGFVSASDVAALLRSETKLVSIALANHETGAVQPIREIHALLPKGVAFHTDAAQAVGKRAVSFRQLGVTALTLSAHKFGGPKGIGALIVKSGTKFKPLILGGHQQKGVRPGTEPVALAVGLAVALKQAESQRETVSKRVSMLRARLWNQLKDGCDAILNGPAIDEPNALPNTLNVSFPGCRADLLLMSLDLAGIACSTGSACSSGSLTPSSVLIAMGLADDRLRSALRFSLPSSITEAETDEAARRIIDCVKGLRVGAEIIVT